MWYKFMRNITLQCTMETGGGGVGGGGGGEWQTETGKIAVHDTDIVDY